MIITKTISVISSQLIKSPSYLFSQLPTVKYPYVFGGLKHNLENNLEAKLLI